jgi:hypothetical protein
MNKISTIILLIILLNNCTKSSKTNFLIIDENIKCYEEATTLLSFISEERPEAFEKINLQIISMNNMSNSLLDINNNKQDRIKQLNELNTLVSNNFEICVKDFGKFELKSYSDSNYYYEMKINYIKCLLEKLNCMDSINMICNNTTKNQSITTYEGLERGAVQNPNMRSDSKRGNK